jgi:hypothetical protein
MYDWLLKSANEEPSNRNLEMRQANSGPNDLLASIQLPIVMVDSALTVRRSTPAALNARAQAQRRQSALGA